MTKVTVNTPPALPPRQFVMGDLVYLTGSGPTKPLMFLRLDRRGLSECINLTALDEGIVVVGIGSLRRLPPGTQVVLEAT